MKKDSRKEDDFDKDFKQLVLTTQAFNKFRQQHEESEKRLRATIDLDCKYPEFQCFECWHRYRVKNPHADFECSVCSTLPGEPEYNPDCEDCEEFCDDWTPWEAAVTCPRCGSRYKVPVEWISERLQFSFCLTDGLEHQELLKKLGKEYLINI